MGNRLQCSLEEINKMSLDEIADISNSHTQEAVLKRLTPERRSVLTIECESRVLHYQEMICRTGYEAASPRSFQGGLFKDPYTQLKKFSHIYTVLSGWMTTEDLLIRENGVLHMLQETVVHREEY